MSQKKNPTNTDNLILGAADGQLIEQLGLMSNRHGLITVSYTHLTLPTNREV